MSLSLSFSVSSRHVGPSGLSQSHHRSVVDVAVVDAGGAVVDAGPAEILVVSAAAVAIDAQMPAK